jgi:MSHA biogenesis protein MshI
MLEKSWQLRLFARAAGSAGAPRSIVGVQLTVDHVAAVRIRTGGAHARLEASRRVKLDAGGAIGPVLRALGQDGLFVGARVHVSLPAGRYETVTVANPPAVPAEELRDALRFQMRGVLPWAPDEAAFDFLHLPLGPDAPEGATPGVLVVAAKKSEVAQVVAPFFAAGIEVDVVDIPELVQRNLLAAGSGESAACSAFLSFDETSSLLTVQYGDDLAFARRMQLPGLGGMSDEDPEHLADRIATNVQRSLEVFARQSGLPDVAPIHVGAHPQAALIARTISELAEIPAEVFDPVAGLGSLIDLASASGASEDFAWGESQLALGAALRDEKRFVAPRARRGRSGPAAWLQRLRKAA